MVVALGVVAVIYLAAGAIAVVITVTGIAQRDFWGAFGGVFIVGAIVWAFRAQLRKPEMAIASIWHSDDIRGKFAYIVLCWVLVPLHVLCLVLLWTVSRYREYAADRGSAIITGAPQDLMSALLKIEGATPPQSDLHGGLAVNAFCIVERRSKWRRFELVMDHPRVEKRIARLEEIARQLGKAEN